MASSPTLGHRHLTHLEDVVLTDEVELWLRRLARVLSIVVVVAFGVAVVQIEVPGSTYIAWQDTASIVALAFATVGLVIAWWMEGLGGALTIIGGVFVGALSAYEYGLFIAFGVALLFLVPGAIFLLAWQRTRTVLSMIVLGAAIALVLVIGGGVAIAAYRDGYGPTHPASATEPLPDGEVSWMWSGGVTTDGAAVVAKVPSGTSVRLRYGPEGASIESGRIAEPDTRGPYYRFNLTDLAPDARYQYAVEIDGTLVSDRIQTFTTFPDHAASFTVAFASCARTGSNGSVFDTIRNLGPDLFLITGDFHYGDVGQNSFDAFAGLYDTQLREPAQAALYAGTPIAYVWDDHDFGPNDAAADSPSRVAAEVSYRMLVPHYDLALEGIDAPIAQAFSIGRVRFILTDSRSDREPAAGGDTMQGTVLGAEQLEWFLAELAASSQSHELVVWVSSIPWITDPEPGADHWGGYAEERATIAAFISEHHIANLLMLAGDAHMLAIDDGSHNDYAPGGGASFPVMQAAALDRPGSMKGGPYSEGAFPGGGQFGLLEVTDDGGGMIHVDLTGLNWEGAEILSFSFDVPTTRDE